MSVLTLEDRLRARLIQQRDCWVYTGALSWNGYPIISTTGKKVARAHRVAYELWVGPIPYRMHIDHACNVRACVNPAHLEACSQAENNRRAAARRRTRLGLAA